MEEVRGGTDFEARARRVGAGGSLLHRVAGWDGGGHRLPRAQVRRSAGRSAGDGNRPGEDCRWRATDDEGSRSDDAAAGDAERCRREIAAMIRWRILRRGRIPTNIPARFSSFK